MLADGVFGEQIARVLLVGQSTESLRALQTMLAHTVVEGLTAVLEADLGARLPDGELALLVLDATRPSADLPSLLVQARARRIAVIALTADPSESTIESLCEQGVLDVLASPASPSLLRAKIRFHLERLPSVRHDSGPASMRDLQTLVEERTRLLALQADIGVALTAGDSLASSLGGCVEALVRHVGAAFARVWTLSDAEPVLELQASAGMYTHLDGEHSRVPVGKFKIGLIAQERSPHLTNQVVGDSRVGDQEWAKKERMVAFAGYPLLIGDRLVGVVALFARHELTQATLGAMASVANSIAQGIERARLLARETASRELVQLERERLHDFLMQAPAVICALRGPAHVFELVNPMYRQLVGDRDFLGKPVREALPEVEGQGLFELLDNVHATGEPFIGNEVSAKLVRDGSGVPQEGFFNFVYQPMRGQDGAVEGILVHAVEVTEQVLARRALERAIAQADALNEELAQAELLLRTLIDNLPELAWSARPDGHIDFYNRRWFEYTGTTLEEMQGWGWKHVHDPALLEAVTVRWKRSLDSGEPFEMEFPLRSKEGEYRWFLTRVRPLRDAKGNIARWFGMNTDVHEQREANRKTSALLAEVSEQTREMALAVQQMRDARDEAQRRLAEHEQRKRNDAS